MPPQFQTVALRMVKLPFLDVQAMQSSRGSTAVD
jgi:hypothetical protein